MTRSSGTPTPPNTSTATYRERICSAGLPSLQIWATDLRAPEFAEVCRRQARAVAASDPAGDEIMRLIANVYK